MKKIILLFSFLGISLSIISQIVPSKEENIDFIVTFGKDAPGTWGDDDHSQVYFVAIPAEYKDNFYLRVFDPETGGLNDQANGSFDTKTKFSIYGGKGCYSEKDARKIDPVGKYKSGALITYKVFESDKDLDNNWYSFGPFNPQEGEYDNELKSTVFKIIIESISGNDGNAYRLSLSSKKDENLLITGSNFFAYEICFRLINKNKETAHLYPFINSNVIKIKQNNFDLDNDGYLRVNSVAKKSHSLATSGDGEWKTSDIEITPGEANTSLDIHIIKGKATSNDVTFYLTNQYKEAVPFFSSPIGGLPKYKYKVDVKVEVK